MELNTTRKDLLLSIGALATTAVAAGCSGSGIVAAVDRNRGVSSLSGVRQGKAAFPLWKTDMKIARRGRLHTSSLPISGGGGDPGNPTDPVGPSGSPPTRTWSNLDGWTAFGYRSDSASSLYDDYGDLALQTQVVLNSDYTVTAQSAGVSGPPVSSTLPRLDSLLLDAPGSLLGLPYYLNTTTNIGTMTVNGVTYTFTQNAAKDLIIHADDGEPDVVVPAMYVVVADAPSRIIHTAGVRCNAASFALGFAGMAIVGTALIAIGGSRGQGALRISSGATSLLTALYNALLPACRGGG